MTNTAVVDAPESAGIQLAWPSFLSLIWCKSALRFSADFPTLPPRAAERIRSSRCGTPLFMFYIRSGLGGILS